MQICNTVSQLTVAIHALKLVGKQIGFVPTMGALHEGHLSLCRQAKLDCDVLVVSIFVNPTQFNNPDDLARYPRTEESDLNLLSTVSCDIVFLPSIAEMYSEASTISFSFEKMEEVLEGKFRPGHFNGVATVVSKLFHMVSPDIAYFGQKDLQQFLIIKQLVTQLSFPLILKCCLIARADSGLALSSRNTRIESSLLSDAAKIFQSLIFAQQLLLNGVAISDVKTQVLQFYYPHSALRLEYFEVVDSSTLQTLYNHDSSSKLAICVAAELGGIRLIDNIIF